MGFRKTIQLNLRYIRVVNGCVWQDVVDFLNDIIDIENAFTSRRYIWNVLRGKTFYKDITHYVSRLADIITSGDGSANARYYSDKLDRIVREIILSEKSEKARQSFVWGLTKKVPLLTVDTIPYMTSERILNILGSDKKVLSDTSLNPFITKIIELKSQINDLESVNETLGTLVGGE